MKRRKAVQCLLAVLGVATVVGGVAVADDASPNLLPISTRLDATYVSKYVWRGIQQTTDYSYEPSLTFSHPSGLSYNIWANYNSSANSAHSNQIIEVDHTFNYAYSYKKISMNSGLIHYMFPNTTSPDTTELYTSFGFSGFLSPTVSVNYDFDKGKGAYFNFGGSYNYALPWKSAKTLALSAKVGYATASEDKYLYFGTDKSAFTDYLITASVPFTVGKEISIVPSLNYAGLINSQIKDNVEAQGLDADNFYGGLTASYSF